MCIKSCNNSQDLTGFFDTYSRLVMTKKLDPPTNATLTGKATWDAQVKSWVNRMELQAGGGLQMHVIVKSQYTE